MSACLVCEKPLSPKDEHAYREALTIEEETADALGVVCPLCSTQGLDPPTPVEHIHLFVDGTAN